MADAYRRYVAEELPLKDPNNMNQIQGDRTLEVSTFAATRPTTEAAVNESLLGWEEPASAFFDDTVGYSMGSTGEMGNNSSGKLEVYDDEYGEGQAPRSSMEHVSKQTLAELEAMRSDDFVEEKHGSVSRGELSGPAIITPVGKWGQHQDSFADADMGIEGGGDEDIVSSDEEGDSDSQIGPQGAKESGLNNLETLQSRHKQYNWRASSTYSDAEYQSEMELFVEDGDDGEAPVGDAIIERSIRAETRLEMMEEMVQDNMNQSSRSILSASNNPMEDPLMPVDMSTVKDMKKEEYWDLFNKILSTPTAHVPEEQNVDPAEVLKQQKKEREAERAAKIKEAREQAKWQRLANRERKRRSLEKKNQQQQQQQQPERSRSTDVFEPPPNMRKPQRVKSVPVRGGGAGRSVDGEVFAPPPTLTPPSAPRRRLFPKSSGPPSRVKSVPVRGGGRSVDGEVFAPPSSLTPPSAPRRRVTPKSSGPPSRTRSVDGEVFAPPPNFTKPRVRQVPKSSAPPSRTRSVDTEVFEPPRVYKPSQHEKATAMRRSSSFGGVTVKERQHHNVLFGKKLHLRLKKPEFVSRTQKVMASFSSKFHHAKRMDHPQQEPTYDG